MAFQSIAKELSEFERDFAGVLDDRDAAVRFLLQYLAGQHAGRLRPKVLLLTAGMQGGTGPESGRMALLVELLHLASLIHDDVIDNASERRNQQTVNAVWDNKIAVLLGDYLLSKVLG
ncbi:MAG: polyprenyl synthetase family protein, partial [Bacteroidales bacterium]|nr:polyprenyl synthetase family protein [Bacteroidales bacterium]